MIKIIYADADFIVINKPQGIAVHGGGSFSGPTLIDILLAEFPEITGVGEDSTRPGIVHRLDRDTSGVMVIARNPESFKTLKMLFQKRLVEKKYLAIVCGEPKARRGIISFPIGRLVKNPTRRGVAGRSRVRGAREAITEYRVLSTARGYAKLELRPRTGRMHQLRVHCAAIGHPIACDRKYGGKNVCCPDSSGEYARAPAPMPLARGRAIQPRQLLHASSISFSYPEEGRRLFFEADLPEDMAFAIKGLF